MSPRLREELEPPEDLRTIILGFKKKTMHKHSASIYIHGFSYYFLN